MGENQSECKNNLGYYIIFYTIFEIILSIMSTVLEQCQCTNVNALLSTDLKSSIDNMNHIKNIVSVKVVNKMRVIHHHPSSHHPTLLVVSDCA